MSDFVYTTAIKKLRKLSKRTKCCPGGTSAGKTFGILPILIDKAARSPRLEISVVSESVPHLRRGAMKDFLKIMQTTNRYIDANWNRTILRYNFSNGSYIEFFSVENEENVRGPRRDILYINEANNISFDTYHQLAIRTSGEIWLDWNPSHEFWAYTELNNDPDTDWLTLTYKDNEALPETIVRELEKGYDKAYKDKTLTGSLLNSEKNIKSNYWHNWVNVYLNGQLGMLEGVIFDNWDQIPAIPPDARLIGRGLDFGYTNDPTAIIDVYKWNDYRIVDERCYQTKLVNSAIAALLNNEVPIYADSAEPKSIDEIRECGINRIEPTMKGKDSINYGIQLMQGQKYLVTKSSVNLIKELRGYCWDKDKNGEVLNKPCGADHCFIGDTLVTTKSGDVPIRDIKVGDLVLTPSGYKKVLIKWDNGYKQVDNYSIKYGNNILTLCCTSNHRVKADNEWISISKLKSGQTVYLCRPIMESFSSYTQKKGTFQKGVEGCMLSYGKPRIKSKYLKDFMFTISMETLGIIELKTLKLLRLTSTYLNMAKKGLGIIHNGLRIFMLKVLKRQKSGTSRKRVLSGTAIMPGSMDLEISLTRRENVRSAVLCLNQRRRIKNTVKTPVKQKPEDCPELIMRKGTVLSAELNIRSISICQKEHAREVVLENILSSNGGKHRVYDLTVEDEHCYFANGILVHNCIDAVRYHEMMSLAQPASWPRFWV